ncbi:MAG TPA: hypothetical protein VEA38_15090 [Terriglobales bacterium]|nr:hypothetical protein [Terriglobales bacterium]
MSVAVAIHAAANVALCAVVAWLVVRVRRLERIEAERAEARRLATEQMRAIQNTFLGGYDHGTEYAEDTVP